LDMMRVTYLLFGSLAVSVVLMAMRSSMLGDGVKAAHGIEGLGYLDEDTIELMQISIPGSRLHAHELDGQFSIAGGKGSIPESAVHVSEVPKVHQHVVLPPGHGLNSPLIVDHVHFANEDMRSGWANVHAYVNGELVTGQIRLVKKAKPESKPDVSAITDVFNKALEDAFSEATTEKSEEAPEEEEAEPEEEPQQEEEETSEEQEEEKPPEEEKQEEEQQQQEEQEQKEEKSEEVKNEETAVETTPVPSSTTEETKNETVSEEKKCPSNVYTVKGCCCKFPFDFQGKEYDKCIDAGHQTPWCYVEEQEEGCGEEYGSLIVHGHGRQDFETFTPRKVSKIRDKNHSFEGGATRWWDHCEPPEVVTHLGCKCKFPFKWKGKEHNICIWDDHNTPWCEVEGDECGAGQYIHKGPEGKSKHRWDNCIMPPPKSEPGHQEEQIPIPAKFKPRREGRHCGDTKSHWLEPWHFNFMCASGVCNFRCKNPIFCPNCDNGNCQCIDPKPSGQTCGDGTNRPPEYSHNECLSGQCNFDCILCTNCNGGNCKCE